MTLPMPALSHLCDLRVTVGPVLEAGTSPMGRRRVIPITGGWVRGPGLSGRVLPAGADFQLITGEADGVSCAALDARYLLALDDGAQVFVHNSALRVASVDDAERLLRGEPVPPERLYFRCQPRFETGDPRHAALMLRQHIGTGLREAGAVRLSFFTVL